MEPFGFAHLRNREEFDTSPTISNRKCKKDGFDVSKLSKSLALSASRLYYPVNTPVCRYQRKLILDSLYNNTLIALPAELDAFFVTAVMMLNFKRWFPTQKVACICTSVESSLNAAKRFVEITGYSKGICVYAIQKKCDRYMRWVEHDIIFTTAESLINDFKSGEALSEICLMVVEDAHRAVAGSHPLSQLIRNCIFAKAKFRVLAYTDCKIDKVGQLQLIVMNLQIDLIRSLGSLKEDVSLAVASPRMNKLYVAIDEHMRHISKQLLRAMESIASLLCECGIFPTNDLSKLVNFSTSYLQKMLLNGGSHLAELYCDFLDLLSAHDILICEGLTAFRNNLQALASRSTAISEIIGSNDILKAYFLPTLSGPDYFQCHKLDILVTLLKKTRAHYDSQKSKVVVLCRDRDPAFLHDLLATIKARLSWEESGFAFFLVKSGNEYEIKISEDMMKDGFCNVVVVPCGFDVPELNIGYVDSLICMDEGLCTLHYTSTVRVAVEGSLLALCSAGYETNIYSFLTAEGTVDCVQIECIKGLQLCNDVSRVIPLNDVPEIVEYWSQDSESRDGLLTTVERLDFEGRLALDDPLDTSKLIENNQRLLNFCMKETFLWQNRPQRFNLLGHCTSISTWTRIVDKDPESLKKQALRLQSMLTSTWISEDLQLSRTDTANSTSEVNKDSKTGDINKPTNQKQMAKNLSGKCPMKVPRLNRIDSASFTLLKVLQPETRLTLIADDFVNCVERHECYRKRQKGMNEIIGKLNILIRI